MNAAHTIDKVSKKFEAKQQDVDANYMHIS